MLIIFFSFLIIQGRVSRKGVDTFSKIKEVFGEDKQTKKMIEAKFAKMNKKLTKTGMTLRFSFFHTA